MTKRDINDDDIVLRSISSKREWRALCKGKETVKWISKQKGLYSTDLLVDHAINESDNYLLDLLNKRCRERKDNMPNPSSNILPYGWLAYRVSDIKSLDISVYHNPIPDDPYHTILQPEHDSPELIRKLNKLGKLIPNPNILFSNEIRSKFNNRMD